MDSTTNYAPALSSRQQQHVLSLAFRRQGDLEFYAASLPLWEGSTASTTPSYREVLGLERR